MAHNLEKPTDLVKHLRKFLLLPPYFIYTNNQQPITNNQNMAEIFFNGPEGRVEAKYHQADDKTAPLAVVLHPHPLYGGSMNNKVVYNLYHNFADNGFSVLRFNFRGIGKSLGKYDNGIGELADAAAALDWIQVQNPDARSCWICGFSFGAWIAMQLMMRRPEITGFVSVSPPVNMYDFSFLTPFQIVDTGEKIKVLQHA